MSEQPVGMPLSMHDPRTVGPWTLHSRLGAGGMGVVFYADAPEWDPVALKVIRPGLLDAQATRDRFRREVAILQSVRDVHISQFLAADLESEPAWLAIEYISGPVLRDQVLDHGPLSEEQWWEVARGLAQALAVLDVHRITHRDLKPGNVILNERGPVVIDFGIAHPEDATALTGTGLVTGSPAWLSPEQANLEPTGPASDVFTLGSLLAFAATGRPPFGEGVSVAVLVAIASKDPDLEGIDPNRTALLRRMLAKEPQQRPTARQILDRTRAATAGRPRAVMPEPPAAAAQPAGEPRSGTTRQDLDPQDPAAGVLPTSAEDEPTELAPPLLPPADPWVAASPLAETEVVAEAPVIRPAEPAAPPAPVVIPLPEEAPLPEPSAPAPATSRRGLGWRLPVGAVVLAGLIGGGWWGLQQIDGADAGGDTPSATEPVVSPPASADEAPAAPSSDQLVAGDWLLQSYRLTNTGSDMSVSGTVVNRGSQPASATLTVWVYLADGTSLGSVSQAVSDVPAGGSTTVTMTGDAVWAPGPKVVLLQAS